MAQAMQPASSSRVVERGTHYKKIESVGQIVDRSGPISLKTNRWTVLQNGMNFQDASGNWVESCPVVQSFAEGVLCTGNTYRVILKNNLDTDDAVALETPDKQQVVSHLAGIGYYDPDSGQSVLLAQMKDCQAELVSSNQIVFRDAFDGSGIEAAVVYTYGVGRFHQDVTFVKRPAFSPADFGMGSRTRLEIISEIVECPLLTNEIRVLPQEKNPIRRAQMVEPDLVDETPVFSTQWRMTGGRAFQATQEGPPALRGVAVTKSLLPSSGNAKVLVEAVGWNDVNAELEKLPVQPTNALSMPQISATRKLPNTKVAHRTQVPFADRLAQITRSKPVLVALNSVGDRQSPSGFVVDWEELQNAESFWFDCGVTYVVNSDNEFEIWGASCCSHYLIKFGYNADVIFHDWMDAESLILTAVDDDTIGDVIDGSSHCPSGYYGAVILDAGYISGSWNDNDFRFMYAALELGGAHPSIIDLGNCTVRNCNIGFDFGPAPDCTFMFDNIGVCSVDSLFHNVGENSGIYLRGSIQDANCGDFTCYGLPFWWELKYFGNLNHAGSDLDTVGNTLLDDYLDGNDPNIILFSLQFTNNYFSTNVVSGTINLQAGIPAYEVVLVNDLDLTNAVWHPFTSTNVTVNLSNGLCTVAVGLRGFPSDARQTWKERHVTLDNSPLTLTITNPAIGTVSRPMIQLQGYANKPLTSLTYDVSNALNAITNLQGYMLAAFYDTNLMAFTTNYFQCYDVALTNGVNAITLHATDLANNSTISNFTVALDYSGDTSPPVLKLVWPRDGTTIVGSDFTLRAQVDEATATVVASMNGETNAGLVEHDGTVWVNNLSLVDGTNYLTLTATDAATNSSTTNLALIKSAVNVTVDPISADQGNQSSVTITGTVNDPAAVIKVNGVSASVNGATWSAENVPIDPTGRPTLDVETFDSNNNPTGATDTNPSRPTTVVLAEYEQMSGYDNHSGNGQNQMVRWNYATGGSWGVTVYESPGSGGIDPPIPPDGPGYTPPIVTSDYGETFAPNWQNADAIFDNGNYYHTSVKTKVMIVPSGPKLPGISSPYLVGVSAMQFDPCTPDSDSSFALLQLIPLWLGNKPIPAEQLMINGRPLVTSFTNYDGSIWGETIISAPAGELVPLTVTTADPIYNDYTFNVQVLPFDVDVDADNTTFQGYPNSANGDLDSEEKRIRDDDSSPGVRIFANVLDFNDDGTPGYADGIDMFGNVHSNACSIFEPLLIEVPSLETLPNATFVFKYSASDPADMTMTGSGADATFYLPAGKTLRIWKKDGPVVRATASAPNGGDFVPADEPCTGAQLGWQQGTNTIKLYMEVVDELAAFGPPTYVEVDFYPAGTDFPQLMIKKRFKVRPYRISTENPVLDE